MRFVSFKNRKDPIYRNSFYLMLSSIARAGFGFLFWIIAAGIYTMGEIGVATAILSTLAIIVTFSRFGIDQSLTRQIPCGDRPRIIYTSVVVTTVSAVIMAALAVLFIDTLIPELTLVKQFFFVFVIFVATSSIYSIYSTAFVALRRSDIVFFQSVIGGSRILLLFPLVFFGAIGIVVSEFAISLLLVVLSVIILLKWKISIFSKFDRCFLRDTLTFSAGNYAASFIATIPSQIISLLIIAVLGANETATFYIGFMVFQLVLVIPTSISTSLFVEGSHGVDLKTSFGKAMRLATALLIPAVILTYILGEWLLGFLGSGYASGGGEFLRVIVLSSFFVAIYSNYISFFKVEKDVKSLVVLSSVLLVLIVAISFALLPVFGIVGVGYAWIISHLIIVMAGYPLMRKNLSKDRSVTQVAKAQ